MRTIKFRAKLHPAMGSEWVYGDYVTGIYVDPEYNSPSISHFISTKKGDDPNNPEFLFQNNYNVRVLDIQEETLGQFTGLYDIDGKEIYEGDIVEKAVNNIISSHRFKIVYSECFAGFCRLYIKKKGTRDGLISLSEMDIDREEIKVIGNIHDNTELLKQ